MEIVNISPRQGSAAKLVGYLHDDDTLENGVAKHPCVVVCPGGGYAGFGPKEAEPVAIQFYNQGYQAFVLYYTVAGERPAPPLGLNPMKDLSAAVRAIRAQSGAWRVAEGALAVCGFSAGGHLAASLGTLWNSSPLDEPGAPSNEPNALILCYPVISAKVPGEHGSLERLAENPGRLAFYSMEDHVGPHTPPTFIWHTADDEGVDVENTLLFASALRHHKVPFECHIFRHGAHGSALCSKATGNENRCGIWFQLCMEWLEEAWADRLPRPT